MRATLRLGTATAAHSSSRHPAGRRQNALGMRQTDRVLQIHSVECRGELRMQVGGTCICKILGVRADEKADSRKPSISELRSRFHGMFEENRVLGPLAARLCWVC